MKEHKLITGLRNGDMAAYETAFQTFYPRFVRFADYIVKDFPLAKDLVQNVFLKLWRYRDRLKPDLSLENYLYVLTKREVLNNLRSRRAAEPLSAAEVLGFPVEDAVRMDRRVDASLVRSLMAVLPEQRRKVFVMSRLQGMTNKEIADALSLSEKTVERHITLAGKQLRAVLAEK